MTGERGLRRPGRQPAGPPRGRGRRRRQQIDQFFNNLPAELTVDPPSQSTKVLSADGKPIATFYAENRVKVGLDQMSPYIKDAIVAIEDSRFYEHAGMDPQGILRALASNLTSGGRQGASTLTQQYVDQRDQ